MREDSRNHVSTAIPCFENFLSLKGRAGMLWVHVATSDTAALCQARWPLPFAQVLKGYEKLAEKVLEPSQGAEALRFSAAYKTRVRHGPPRNSHSCTVYTSEISRQTGEGNKEQFKYQMASPWPKHMTSLLTSVQIAPLWESSSVLLHNSTPALINNMH